MFGCLVCLLTFCLVSCCLFMFVFVCDARLWVLLIVCSLLLLDLLCLFILFCLVLAGGILCVAVSRFAYSIVW